MERKEIKPVDFGKAEAKPNPINIKLFTGEIPELPKKHKVKTMFRIKSSILSWGLGVLASIPEEYIWKFVKEVISRIEGKIENSPKWVKVCFALLVKIVEAVNPDSPGGRRITKEELKSLVDELW